MKNKIYNLAQDFSQQTKTISAGSFNSHLAIMLLGVLIIGTNLFIKNSNYVLAQSNSTYLDIDTQEISTIIENVAPYTFFDEDLENTKLTLLAGQNDEYLNKQDKVITEKSQLEVEYLVQKNDTLSIIANKFNMHVATILDRNQLTYEDVEKITPGQKLIIPTKDTSDSKEWLVKLNEKKEQERQEKQRQLALKKQQEGKKKTLALSKRSTTYRETSSSGYEGVADGSWGQPINYKYISRGIQKGHSGIDMIAGVGTPVYAAKSGKVVGSTGGWGSGYGLSLELDHGGGQSSRYAHLSSFSVGVGEYASKGQLIGYSGNTGWSTGPHLHFEARQNNSSFNPW